MLVLSRKEKVSWTLDKIVDEQMDEKHFRLDSKYRKKYYEYVNCL